ncbi:histone deacetylase family protein [Roseobacter sp. HKCCD5988]|uniref:histone deacetylase family protein n=1 Tax=Roseobacter sp. HKCCD5988 TaxID=3120338 RepID=UPI0030EE9302
MATWLFENPFAQDHLTLEGHPEQVARIAAIKAHLDSVDFVGLERHAAPLATEEDLRLCHPQAYIDQLKGALPTQGQVALDGDTFLSPASWQAALSGVGGMIAAIDAVMEGRAKNAFVLTRPPGHHAETATAMGFCLFGSVAIGAKHALERAGAERVAVIDFDVHHGNGTQDLLWDETRALFVSSHQMPLYPGSGARGERGVAGNILNVPLPPNSDGALMQQVYLRDVFPRLVEFAPDLILISAGFDAHQADPLANLNWDETDFAWLTREICAFAETQCAGRVVSALEGGYDLPSLGRSVAAHVTELMEASK